MQALARQLRASLMNITAYLKDVKEPYRSIATLDIFDQPPSPPLPPHSATMDDFLCSLVIWLIVCNTVQSAGNSTNSTGSTNNSTGDDYLCGKTFDSVNAVRECIDLNVLIRRLTESPKTGFFSFNPGVLIPSLEPPPDATWAVTLVGGVPQDVNADYIFWYDTGGLNYSNSSELGYDVCAIYFEPLGIYNNTDMRAQHDNGSCLAAFDLDCVAALEQQSEDFAMQLVGSPTALPNSNLTAGSLPGVCDSLAQMMTSALPKQCTPYINEGMVAKTFSYS